MSADAYFSTIRGMTFLAPPQRQLDRRHAFTSVDAFQQEARATIQGFQEEMKELNEMIQTDAPTLISDQVPSSCITRSPRRLPTTSADSSFASSNDADSAIETIRHITETRIQRKRAMHSQMQGETEPTARIVQPKPMPIQPVAPIPAVPQIVQGRSTSPSHAPHELAPPPNRAPWLSYDFAGMVDQTRDKSPATRPRPMPLMPSPPRSVIQTEEIVGRMARSPFTRAHSASASTNTNQPKWQRLFQAAVAHGRSIRHETPVELSIEGQNMRGMYWPLLTPPPTRIDYATVQRQQFHSTSATAARSVKYSRQRSASPQDHSHSPSRPDVPFAFSASTPLPVRSSTAARRWRNDPQSVEQELERLDIKRFHSTDGNMIPAKDDCIPSKSVPGGVDHQISPGRLLVAALESEREELRKQLEFERQSWKDEKELIWKHYQTDIEALMKPEDHVAVATRVTPKPSSPPSPQTSPPMRVTFQPLPTFSPSTDPSSITSDGSVSVWSDHASDNLTTSQLASGADESSASDPSPPPLSVTMKARGRTIIDWSPEAISMSGRSPLSASITFGRSSEYSDIRPSDLSRSTGSSSFTSLDLNASRVETKLRQYDLLLPNMKWTARQIGR